MRPVILIIFVHVNVWKLEQHFGFTQINQSKLSLDFWEKNSEKYQLIFVYLKRKSWETFLESCKISNSQFKMQTCENIAQKNY